MHSIKKICPVFICFLYAVFPLLSLIGAVCGYTFSLADSTAEIIAIVAFSIAAFLLCVFVKTDLSAAGRLCSTVLPVLAVISGFYFIYQTNRSVSSIVYTVVVCAIALGFFLMLSKTVKYRNAFAVLAVISAVLLILLFSVSLFFRPVFGGMSADTTVKVIPSPNNTLVAELLTMIRVRLAEQRL